MTASFKDISGKIELPVVEALVEVDAAARAHGTPFLVIGARARDIFFSMLFGIQTNRETTDLDLAIRVAQWAQYRALVDGLLGKKNFTRDNRVSHRLWYKGFLRVDIIPFGEIEEPAGSISFPPDHQTIMSTVGFSEAFESSMTVRLSWNPVLDLKISTPASLAIMKLVSWHEKYPERGDDAKDLLFLMKEYINAGNDTRLYAEDADIVAMKDFDYDMASPRLLGRDIGKVAGITTLVAVKQMLDEQTRDGSCYALIQDMISGRLHTDELFQNTLNLVKQLRAGVFDIDMTDPTCSSSDD